MFDTLWHDIIIILGYSSLGIAVWGWRHWRERRKIERQYRDGIFAVLKGLDAPLEDWEKQLRSLTMTDAEWFGYQRGYAQALLDALRWFGHSVVPPLHTNRLEPTPDEDESLSDMAKR